MLYTITCHHWTCYSWSLHYSRDLLNNIFRCFPLFFSSISQLHTSKMHHFRFHKYMYLLHALGFFAGCFICTCVVQCVNSLYDHTQHFRICLLVISCPAHCVHVLMIILLLNHAAIWSEVVCLLRLCRGVNVFDKKWCRCCNIQCGAVIAQSIFSKILKKMPHSSPARARYGVCLLWIWILIYILLQSLQKCIQCHVVLDHVITTPDCMYFNISQSNITHYWTQKERKKI